VLAGVLRQDGGEVVDVGAVVQRQGVGVAVDQLLAEPGLDLVVDRAVVAQAQVEDDDQGAVVRLQLGPGAALAGEAAALVALRAAAAGEPHGAASPGESLCAAAAGEAGCAAPAREALRTAAAREARRAALVTEHARGDAPP